MSGHRINNYTNSQGWREAWDYANSSYEADSRVFWSTYRNLTEEDTPLNSHLETLPVRSREDD